MLIIVVIVRQEHLADQEDFIFRSSGFELRFSLRYWLTIFEFSLPKLKLSFFQFLFFLITLNHLYLSILEIRLLITEARVQGCQTKKVMATFKFINFELFPAYGT